MKKIVAVIGIALCSAIGTHNADAQSFQLNDRGYFNYEGVDAMVLLMMQSLCLTILVCMLSLSVAYKNKFLSL
jgi:hypothetical protein